MWSFDKFSPKKKRKKGKTRRKDLGGPLSLGINSRALTRVQTCGVGGG
jgi:hypothetical protein